MQTKEYEWPNDRDKNRTRNRGNILTESRMQTKEYEWRNDRDKNRTRNRGNIMPECKLKNDGMQKFNKK